jgi:uncharacterized Zn finger protein (UPF0148 family)
MSQTSVDEACGHCGTVTGVAFRYHDGTPYCWTCGNDVLNAMLHMQDMATCGQEPAESETAVLADSKLFAAWAEYARDDIEDNRVAKDNGALVPVGQK